MQVSVIVPVYNAGQTIESCLESVLLQSFGDFELVVVNDGSSDGSGVLIDAAAARDGRVVAIHQANKGRTEARHAGVERASGEWVCFVDSDDTLPPDALENLMEGTRRGDTDIVLGNGRSLPGPLRECIGIGEFRHLTVRAEGTIGVPWGSLYRRSVLTDRLFDLPRHVMMGEDYIFWLRLVFSTEKAVNIVQDSVYCKGEEHTSNCFRWTAAYAHELDGLRREAIPQGQREEYMADMLCDRLANMYSVAQWSRRREWEGSPFHRELLADLRASGMSIPPKGRLFLSLPSLRLRRLYSWVSSRLA